MVSFWLTRFFSSKHYRSVELTARFVIDDVIVNVSRDAFESPGQVRDVLTSTRVVFGFVIFCSHDDCRFVSAAPNNPSFVCASLVLQSTSHNTATVWLPTLHCAR